MGDLTTYDAPALRGFFLAIPAEDRTFFFQDVNDPAVADRWAGDERAVRRGAFADDGRLVAFASLQPGTVWRSHVAEVVLVVGPGARRTGLGRALAGEMLRTALQRGYRKVSVVSPAENTGALEMFRRMGIDQEALLREQLSSPEDGSLRDVPRRQRFRDPAPVAFASLGAVLLDPVAERARVDPLRTRNLRDRFCDFSDEPDNSLTALRVLLPANLWSHDSS